MTRTLTPGQVLSAEDVGLLKAGALVRNPGNGAPWIGEFHGVEGDHILVSAVEDGPYQEAYLPGNFTFIGTPAPDGWIAWSGGPNPVPDQYIDFQVRSGSLVGFKMPMLSDTLRGWEHIGFSGDIIAFRLSRPEASATDGVPALSSCGVDCDCTADCERMRASIMGVNLATPPAPASSPAGEDWEREMSAAADDVAHAHDAAQRATIDALQADNARLREALTEARDWHDGHADDLGKQPPNADLNWRRMEHHEERDRIDQALATKEKG